MSLIADGPVEGLMDAIANPKPALDQRGQTQINPPLSDPDPGQGMTVSPAAPKPLAGQLWRGLGCRAEGANGLQ
jgi:hypothetical protein